MKDESFLAQKFNSWRTVIEAAETPFQKLAIFFLPILAPVVPATFTGLHMYKLLLEVFGEGQRVISAVLAFVVAIVLELLGYVGAMTFISSVFDLVRKGRDEYLIPAVINFFAYAFYLVLMFMVNIKLGQYFGTPQIINSIIGWLSFITVPTGLLAANYLSAKETKEFEKEIFLERKDERLKKAFIKSGGNPFSTSQVYEVATPIVEEGKRGDWRLLNKQERHEVVHVLSVEEIMSKHNVARSTAYEWKKYEV